MTNEGIEWLLREAGYFCQYDEVTTGAARDIVQRLAAALRATQADIRARDMALCDSLGMDTVDFMEALNVIDGMRDRLRAQGAGEPWQWMWRVRNDVPEREDWHYGPQLPRAINPTNDPDWEVIPLYVASPVAVAQPVHGVFMRDGQPHLGRDMKPTDGRLYAAPPAPAKKEPAP